MPSVPKDLHTCGPRVDSHVSTIEMTEVWQTYQQAYLFRQLTLQGLRAHRASRTGARLGENHLGESPLHWASRRMVELRNSYFYAAQSLKDYLPRGEPGLGEEWFPYMVLRACVNGSMALWLADVVSRDPVSLPDSYTREDIADDSTVNSRRQAAGLAPLQRGDVVI